MPEKIIKPTIKDVAEKSGVSIGTVSRVINNKQGVKQYTKEKVLEAMKDLGYQPDVAARELVSGRGITIGLNHSNDVNKLTPFYFYFQRSLSSEVHNNGFRFKEIENGADGLPEKLPDAMVLFGAHDDDPRLEYLIRSSVPFVLIGHLEGVSCVASDDFDGGRQAARHLVRLGHRNIVHISGFMRHQAFNDRYNGFSSVLRESGIEHQAAYVLDGKYTALGGYRAARKFIESGNPFTAVFAASDEMAAGAVAAIEDAGMRVPDDISVVGFDDMPNIGENLTTVHQEIPMIASKAFHLIQDELENRGRSQILLPVQLIARQSTKKYTI